MSERRILPQRRYSETSDLRFWNQSWKITVGYFNNGEPGEIFVSGTKTGTDLDAMARDGAILLSLAIQYGVPLSTIAKALTRGSDGAPGAITGAIVDRLLGV